MPENETDYGVVSAWFAEAADATVGPMGAAHAPVRKRGRPAKGKSYYRGAIFPGGPQSALRIVVRTRRHEGPVAALRKADWNVEVTDPGTTGAPRVWVTIPHERANPAALKELGPLLDVWDGW